MKKTELNKSLLIAIHNGDIHKAKLMLASGADPNAKEVTGKYKKKNQYTNTLEAALYCSYFLEKNEQYSLTEEMFSTLLQAGAEINQGANYQDGFRVLHLIADCGFTNILRIILRYKIDINIRDNRGYTPLHWAVTRERTDTIKLLISSGADVNAEDEDGISPISCTINEEIKKILLEAGAKKQILYQTPNPFLTFRDK